MQSSLFKRIAYVPAINREQWLELRKEGIGGSDAGAIAGLSKWSSAFSVYCDKLGLVPEQQDNETIRQGRDLEEYVAKRFEESENKKVRRYGYLLRSELYPWAIADVDRVLVGENALLECKTTSLLNKTDFENGDIPEYWYCQCQHYLAVTGCDRCYLAIAVLGKAYYSFIIERNEDDIKALMELEKAFWEGNVKRAIPPSPDGSVRAGDVIKGLYPKESTESTVCDLTPFSDELKSIHELDEKIKELDRQQSELKQKIQLYLQDSSIGVCGGFKVNWKAQERNSIDTARLKKEQPEIYAQYLKTTVSRPFKITYKE